MGVHLMASSRDSSMSAVVDSGMTSSSLCPACSWCLEDAVSLPAIGMSFVTRADEFMSTSRRLVSAHDEYERPARDAGR
jgi:hypothetical protein